MRYTARLSAFALALAASAVVVQPAMASEGGTVFGSAWIDANEDGIRQTDEKPLANFTFLVPGVYYAGTTDENGNYKIENVPAGTRVVTLFARGTWTFTKGGGDSDFDPSTLQTRQFTLTEGGQAGPFNAGMVEYRPDATVTDVDVPRFMRVGEQVNIDVTYTNTGNAPNPLYGTATLPDGLTPLSTNAPVPWIDGQKVYMSSMYQPDVHLGESVTYTIVARVDKQIRRGEIVVTEDQYGDVNPSDNVKKVKVWAF
ncbi:hypothetical protein Lesp02_53870 [Lentzea sp. NBRC 105346]|uniref:SdrD B-like domain-containing protein n=1 Tax=Lentzea sp. NBRC 105346 TaxID=3032205 RepID=UPI0024A32C32|nr:SdrD B-like domain-containing protein [Lentzea sp. NBRC 105346]GLZ33199.1 hypothetical protein Lesp02_53870 [Lentzea sp. NBRC 105346]